MADQTWTFSAADLTGGIFQYLFPSTGGGGSGNFQVTVTYVVSPVSISSITPTTLCEGEDFVISGTDLASASSVTIGGSAAVIVSNTNNEIVATAQSGSSSGTVQVVASAGTANSSGSVTVNALPAQLNAGDDVAFCDGGSTALSASAIGAPGGTAGVTILSEGFETSNTTFPPTGWTTFRGTNGLGTVRDWHGGVTGAYSGTYCARVIYENVSGGTAEDWLVTEAIDLSNFTSPELNFKIRDYYTANYGSTFTVKVSEDSQTDHADFTTVWGPTGEPNAGVNWVGPSSAIDLSNYEGKTIYIAFIWANDDGDICYLDEITVTGTQRYDVSYSWSPSTGLSADNVSNPTATPTNTTNYTLTATTNGCSATDDVNVTVYANPVAGSVAVTDLSVSGNADLTEAIEADQITWTNLVRQTEACNIITNGLIILVCHLLVHGIHG